MPAQKSADTGKDILTTTEAARLLGVSVRTAQLLIEGGSIPSWKTPGGHRRVYRSDVLAIVDGIHDAPVFSSATVILIASPERLSRYQSVLTAVPECVIDSYSDVFAASFAIGSRLPIAVVVDLAEEALPLLRSLIVNPALGRTHVIAVGAHEGEGLPLRPDFDCHLDTAERLPETIQSILRDNAEANLSIPETLAFPVAANEGRRLEALKRSELVDTPPEDGFDRLTWLAARGLGMPVALLTLLTSTRQWFKSRHGLDLTETPRAWAFCNHTILQKDIFMVEDLAADARFATNPGVADKPGFKFYAGAPVFDPDGFALGSLCVLDYAPRSLNADQARLLLTLAALVSDQIRLRMTNRQLRWAMEILNRTSGK
jgi:excisionase family DNA binding protein